MSVSERPRKPVLPRRAAAVAAAFALVAGSLAYGASGAQATVAAPSASQSSASQSSASQSSASQASAPGGTHWAVTLTGKKVRVPKPKFIKTPLHPEKITHPGRDYMGSTVASHFKGGHAKPETVPQLPGIDVSAYQGDIDWSDVCPYIDFSYAKATEGTYYTNPDFYNQYEGPYDCGVIRGAYHFANPSNSEGNTQADYFVDNGGGWSADGLTLPGLLDIEYNPYGAECYSLTQSQMVDWLWDFVNEYAYRTGAYPVIYTTTDWWTTCTGNYGGFGAYDPLDIANYSASGGGPLPNGWSYYTFWQYADSGSLPGDQDVFNGAYSQLQAIAKG
jgi:GH25 family lysozyme M1 (1,4-beta-N-acetylmuramidase)